MLGVCEVEMADKNTALVVALAVGALVFALGSKGEGMTDGGGLIPSPTSISPTPILEIQPRVLSLQAQYQGVSVTTAKIYSLEAEYHA